MGFLNDPHTMSAKVGLSCLSHLLPWKCWGSAMLVMRQIGWDGSYLGKGGEQRTSWVGQLEAFPECAHSNLHRTQIQICTTHKYDNKQILFLNLDDGCPSWSTQRPSPWIFHSSVMLVSQYRIDAKFWKFIFGYQDWAVTKIIKFTKDRMSWFLVWRRSLDEVHYQPVMIISPRGDDKEINKEVVKRRIKQARGRLFKIWNTLSILQQN